MNYNDVLSALRSLPPTFRRIGNNYAGFEASFARFLSLHTNSADAIWNNLILSNATGPWLDLWGAILGLPRLPGEADTLFRLRLQTTYMTPVGTSDGITAILLLAFGLATTVTETSGGGYIINLSQPVTNATLANIFATLSYIRPAGVPFIINATSGGLILDSINYFGGSKVTGSYLGSPTRSTLLGANAYTGAIPSSLPSILFSDPILWSQP